MFEVCVSVSPAAVHNFNLAVQIVQQPTGWTKSDYIALIAALAAIATVFLAVWPYLHQRIVQRRISKDFGADLYLPEVIKASTRYYVRPEASSLDLSQELEDPSNRVPTREDLFRAVERFLDDESEQRHLFLLADSGMGKSAFVLNFYAYNQRRLALKRYRLAVLPLGSPKVIDLIREIADKRRTVIFLDAFDEDPMARHDYWARLKVLLEECSEFKRVLITCRTQFFPKDDAIPISTGMFKLGPRNGDATYQFWRLYIAPLSDDQVDQYLRIRFRLWEYSKRRRARKIVHKIPLLTLRPMLLANIPEIMAAKVNVVHSWQLYELMIREWYKREKDWWQDQKSIQMFSEEVAVKLYLNYLQQKADRIPRSDLTEIARTISLPVDEWVATSRSLLHRDAQGNFKFAHRSIMEYLVIKRFMAGDKRCRNVTWTDQMREFMVEILRTPRGFEDEISIWQRFELIGADLHETDLNGVVLQGKNLSGAIFTRANLSHANCHRTRLVGTDFSDATLDDAVITDAEAVDYRYTTQAPPNFQGARLRRADVSGSNLQGANFDNADLTEANLKKTNLRDATMLQTLLVKADLRGARLLNTNCDLTDFRGAHLRSASIGIVNTSLRGARLANAVGLTEEELSTCDIDENTQFPKQFEGLKAWMLSNQKGRQ